MSQKFEVPIKVDAFELYRVLRIVNPSPYMYYMKLQDREIVGSSPERLIHVQDGHLKSIRLPVRENAVQTKPKMRG